MQYSKPDPTFFFTEIQDFLWEISQVCKRLLIYSTAKRDASTAWDYKILARDFVSAHAQNLKVKLSEAKLKGTGDFLWGISRFDTILAKKIISTNKPTLRIKLSEASLKEITDFLWEISSAHKELARKVVFAHRETLKTKDIFGATLQDIEDFLRIVSNVDREVAGEIVANNPQTFKIKMSETGEQTRETFFQLLKRRCRKKRSS